MGCSVDCHSEQRVQLEVLAPPGTRQQGLEVLDPRHEVR
jgi:hypothetical protein